MGEDAEADGMGPSVEALEEGVLFSEDLRGLNEALLPTISSLLMP